MDIISPIQAYRHMVILGTYNNARHVEFAIESIRQQVDDRWHCLIVDNGSTDDTVAVAKGVIRNDARFRLLTKTNQGPSAGRNYGMAAAPSSNYVSFLDGDDELHPDFLASLGNHLDQHPHCGLVSCQFDRIDPDGLPLGPGFRSRFAPGRGGLPRKMHDDEVKTDFVTFFCATGQGPFALFRRAVLDRTELYTESFWSHEDSDIFCQMSLLAEVHARPERLYRKREHRANLSASGRSNYTEFRAKWDWYHLAHPEHADVIVRARRYYYRVHRPLRDIKIGLLYGLRPSVRSPDIAKIKWGLSLLKSGAEGLLLGRYEIPRS